MKAGGEGRNSYARSWTFQTCLQGRRGGRGQKKKKKKGEKKGANSFIEKRSRQEEDRFRDKAHIGGEGGRETRDLQLVTTKKSQKLTRPHHGRRLLWNKGERGGGRFIRLK